MAKAKKLDGTASRGTVTINAPSNNWLEKETPTRVIDLDEERTVATEAQSAEDEGIDIPEASAPANGNDLPLDEAGDSDAQDNAGDDPQVVKGNSKKPNARAKKNSRNRVTAKKHAKREGKTTAKPAKQPKPMPGAAEAQEINEEHDALTEEFTDLGAELIPKAIQIGEKLKKIKKSVGHGHFEKWVEKHLAFDIRTARRYMAKTKAKRTALSDMKACGDLATGYAADGIAPKEPAVRTVPFKVFSSAATKVLNQPVETILPDHKFTILRDYERLEPIALQLQEHPSIFALTWQKKMAEPPVRWARKDVALFKAEIAKAQTILAELEKDAQFDNEPDAPVPQIETPAPIEGDTP